MAVEIGATAIGSVAVVGAIWLSIAAESAADREVALIDVLLAVVEVPTG